MYAPETLVIDTWTSPVSISGTDLIKNLDEAVNSIVSTDANSIKNHVNRELAKIPTYLSAEATKVYNETNLSAVSALDSKNSALASATTATDNATIATTKASEASTSAGEALASKNLSVTSAGNALVSEQNADTSEAQSLSYKNSAEASATTATTQAGIATTKAGEASTSASQALTSRNEAEVFRDEAETFALSVDSANLVHKTGDTMTGNLVFASGTKIQGDFSNATLANRTAFQTSTVNGNTSIYALPNGTAQTSGWNAFNSQDPTNASYIAMYTTPTTMSIDSGIRGTGTYLPLTVGTGGAERLRIDTLGNVLVTGSGGLGYGTGSGGAVTQLTSKSTAVTLNKPCGTIIMNNASLASLATVSFLFNNSLLGPYDTFKVCITNANGVNILNYEAEEHILATGAGSIKIKNISGGALAEAVQLNFAIIKGAIA